MATTASDLILLAYKYSRVLNLTSSAPSTAQISNAETLIKQIASDSIFLKLYGELKTASITGASATIDDLGGIIELPEENGSSIEARILSVKYNLGSVFQSLKKLSMTDFFNAVELSSNIQVVPQFYAADSVSSNSVDNGSKTIIRFYPYSTSYDFSVAYATNAFQDLASESDVQDYAFTTYTQNLMVYALARQIRMVEGLDPDIMLEKYYLSAMNQLKDKDRYLKHAGHNGVNTFSISGDSIFQKSGTAISDATILRGWNN